MPRVGRSNLGSVVIAALVAILAILVLSKSTPVLDRLEQQTVDTRFSVRGVQPADGIVVIGIDEDTFSELHTTWPLNRRRHAEMIDHLHRARVRQIVYDTQFPEPSPDLRADLALFKAAGRAGHVIFATGESDAKGRPRVLGGPKTLAETAARAGASNFPTDENGVVRRYERAVA